MRILRHLIPERIPGFAAALYDKVARTAVDSYYRPLAAEVVAEIDSGNLLDIGCGPGYLAIEIAKVSPNSKITGIDLSKKMVKIAHSNAEKAGVSDRVNFEKGNANKLRFADNSFDMIISTGAFHSWKRPALVLCECHRVLKPGKEAWIYDPSLLGAVGAVELLKTLKGLDWLAYKWASFVSKLRPGTYDIAEVYELIDMTSFNERWVEARGGWMKIKLRK